MTTNETASALPKACPRCQGSGEEPGAGPRWIAQRSASHYGAKAEIEPCRDCRGSGEQPA